MVTQMQRHATDRSEMSACLEHPRRRSVVDYLAEESPPAQLEEVTRYVATRESGPATDEDAEKTLQRVAISLYHIHLPKMDDADIVAFEEDAHAIERGPCFRDAESRLR